MCAPNRRHVALCDQHPLPKRNRDVFVSTNLRDALLVLPPEESGPGDPARVLALQEETLSLAVLEPENLAVSTDVELALFAPSASAHRLSLSRPRALRRGMSDSCCCGISSRAGGGLGGAGGRTHLARVDLLAAEGIVVGTHVGGVDAIPVVLVSGVVVEAGVFGGSWLLAVCVA